MKMKTLLSFKIILLLHPSLVNIVNSHDHDHCNHYEGSSDSQSQENNSDMDGVEAYKHHYNCGNLNNGYNAPSVLNFNKDECNNCACKKCDNPPTCCQRVCDSCPKPVKREEAKNKQIKPRIEIILMPGMSSMQSSPLMSLPSISLMQMPSISLPQMSIPSMSMPAMSRIAKPPISPLQMPTMPMAAMQIPIPMTGHFSSHLQNPYMPMESNFMTILKSMAPSKLTHSVSSTTVQTSTLAPTQSTSTPIITNVPITKLTTTSTTIITTTPATTTVLSTQQQTLRMPLYEDQNDDCKQDAYQYLKSQRDDNDFESVLKSAIDDFSNIRVKMPEKNKDGNNKYMLTSMRRTKPTWMPKFGIVPIPNNMARRLMLELRSVQNTRSR